MSGMADQTTTLMNSHEASTRHDRSLPPARSTFRAEPSRTLGALLTPGQRCICVASTTSSSVATACPHGAADTTISGGRTPRLPVRHRSRYEGEWRVAHLDDRRVEIAGSVDRKMMINALRLGAKVFMAALSASMKRDRGTGEPHGQLGASNAARFPRRKALRAQRANGDPRRWRRGWHLVSSHASIDGVPMSASLCGCTSFTTLTNSLHAEPGPTSTCRRPRAISRSQQPLERCFSLQHRTRSIRSSRHCARSNDLPRCDSTSFVITRPD